MALYRSQMAAYARAQCDAAQLVLAGHVPDGADCCAACGRVTPCPARCEAQQLLLRYTPWLASAPAPAGAHRFPQAGRLVRPYVRNAARP